MSKDISDIVYLVYKKNLLNLKRRNSLKKANKIKEKWAQVHHTKYGEIFHEFMPSAYPMQPYSYIIESLIHKEIIWFYPKAEKQYGKHIEDKLKASAKGKKLMIRLKKLAKRLNVRFSYDPSGFISKVIKDDNNVLYRSDVEHMYTSYLAEKFLLSKR